MSRQLSSSDVAILANAHISDDPLVMQIVQLAPEVRSQIIAFCLLGQCPVSVRWRTGEFAIMFCVSGTNMPTAQNIIASFKGCRRSKKIFPEGSVSCKNSY